MGMYIGDGPSTTSIFSCGGESAERPAILKAFEFLPARRAGLGTVLVRRRAVRPLWSQRPGGRVIARITVATWGSEDMSSTTRSTTRLTCLLLVCALAAVSLAIPGSTLAAGDMTVLSIDGEPNDPVSQGKSFVLYQADATYVSATTTMGEDKVHIQFGVPPGGVTSDTAWGVQLASPNWWEPLVPGTYPWRTASDTGGSPPVYGNGFSSRGYGCYSLSGSFTVHELSMDWPDVYSLSASFVQTCAESPNDSLYGEVRYNAPGGFKAAEAKPFVLDFGQQDTGSRTATRNVTVKATGTQPVTFGAAQIVGPDAPVFSLESNACSGVTLQPDESCLVGVAARPGTNRVLTAELRVADDTNRTQHEPAGCPLHPRRRLP
jgi:hypothetical protein